MNRKIRIFDTTLRDGEQAPGFSMSIKDKLDIAKHLEALKVDVIEAGFAVVSEGDFQSVEKISKQIRNCTVASLCRALQSDIDRAYEALRFAQSPLINIVIATSDLHMREKLQKSPDEVLELIRESVSYAKKLCSNVQFTAEDATRSDSGFLYKAVSEAVSAGAASVCLPDTVGCSTPEEIIRFFADVTENVKGIEKVVLAAHCHNDLGLAVANSLSAVLGGAGQIECTINGIGERAGNAALEEIIMAMRVKNDCYPFETGIDTQKLYRTSKAVTIATGMNVAANKAIVGKNAFSHESGIHQHGVLKNPLTYEILDPKEVGYSSSDLVLGKHSGKHALLDFINSMGYSLNLGDLDIVFEKFKQVADKKSNIAERDVEALVYEYFSKMEEIFKLDSFLITTGNKITTTAFVSLTYRDGTKKEATSLGDGPVDAAYNAIENATDYQVKLIDYKIEAVTGGKDALGEVRVRIKKDDRLYSGRGLSTDVIEASILAYISALNNMANAMSISADFK